MDLEVSMGNIGGILITKVDTSIWSNISLLVWRRKKIWIVTVGSSNSSKFLL